MLVCGGRRRGAGKKWEEKEKYCAQSTVFIINPDPRL